MPIKPAPIRRQGSSGPSTPTVKTEPGQSSSQMFEYGGPHRYGSAGTHGSPTFSQPSFGGSPGSPVLVNNPGRGQTLDPALFNPPSFHGHPPATGSSSGSPRFSAANSREVNNMFEQLTNHDSTDLYTKDSSAPATSGYESLAAQALEQGSNDNLDSVADQFLHQDP